MEESIIQENDLSIWIYEQEKRRKLIDGYINLYKPSLPKKERDSYFWAWELLDQIVIDFPEEALKIVFEMSEVENIEPVVVSCIAAGPMENLLVLHGDKVIDDTVVLARRNPPFKLLLKCVWKNSMDNNTWERLQILVKEK